MIDVGIILAALVLLALIGVVSELRARHRVRPAKARTVSPAAIRYVATPREDR